MGEVFDRSVNCWMQTTLLMEASIGCALKILCFTRPAANSSKRNTKNAPKEWHMPAKVEALTTPKRNDPWP